MKKFPGKCVFCKQIGLLDGCVSILGIDPLFRYHTTCVNKVIENPQNYTKKQLKYLEKIIDLTKKEKNIMKNNTIEKALNKKEIVKKLKEKLKTEEEKMNNLKSKAKKDLQWILE